MTFYLQTFGFFFVLFAVVLPNLLSNACSVNELQNCTQNNNTECCRRLSNPLWMLEVGLLTGQLILVSIFCYSSKKRHHYLICFLQGKRDQHVPNECQSLELCTHYYSQLVVGLSQLTSSLSEQITFKDNHDASFIGIGLKSIVYKLKNDICNFVSY